MIKYSLLIFISLSLAACSCSAPLKVTSIQRGDKQLTCKDIILEINEAEHYRDQAQKTRGVSVSEVLTPTCWVSGYVDSAGAVNSANARINYLGQIYDLLDCARQSTTPPPKVQPVAPPPPPPPPRMQRPPQFPLFTPNYPGGAYGATNLPLTGNQHYRRIPGPDPWLHEHKDANGKIYQHSHQHRGPHQHAEDQKGMPLR